MQSKDGLQCHQNAVRNLSAIGTILLLMPLMILRGDGKQEKWNEKDS